MQQRRHNFLPLLAETRATGESAPSHRVYVGRAEIGAAWNKVSNEGRPYLGLKLDGPSFTAPIYASLFDDEEGGNHSLIWSPPVRRELREQITASPGKTGRGISIVYLML